MINKLTNRLMGYLNDPTEEITIHKLSGVFWYKDDRLPCSKTEAICLPKECNINREFWVDDAELVWGYFDKIGFECKVYLSEKSFERMKNLTFKLS